MFMLTCCDYYMATLLRICACSLLRPRLGVLSKYVPQRAKRLEAIPNFPWVQPNIKRLKPLNSKKPDTKPTDNGDQPHQQKQQQPVFIPVPVNGFPIPIQQIPQHQQYNPLLQLQLMAQARANNVALAVLANNIESNVVADSEEADFAKKALSLAAANEASTTVDESWARERKTWDEWHAELVENKHILHTHTYKEMDEQYNGLGKWLKNQRKLYAKKDKKFMKER